MSDVPVIVATARDDDASVVRLLDAGADDYVIKPFSSAQIDARIRAVLRRLGQGEQGESTVDLGALRIDPRSREVTVDGSPVDLTRKEFDLLLALSRRPGAVVSKRELLAEVNPPPGGVSAPKPFPNDHNDGDGDDRKGPPKLGDADYRSVGGGTAVEVDVDTVNGPASVCLYLTADELYDGLTPRLLILIGGSLAVLLLSIVGAELVSRRLARPLEETASTAERLAKGDIDARAPTTGPAEVAKVGAALNGLADRIDEVIAVEREAVADLSHRLRTPLTALRLQVEALPDRERAEELNTQVTSLERTLTAVISAARRPQREGRVPHCDAVEVTRSRAAFWEPLFEDQGRELALDLPEPPAMVRSSAEDLGAALDALVENVVAHTPDGTPARITLTREQNVVRIAVADKGPGIPLGAGERGRSDRGSTGLGLDIARRYAEATGGHLTIHANEVVLTLAVP